jgi:TolB protein
MARLSVITALVTLGVLGACSSTPEAADRGYLVITGANGSVETVDMTTDERVAVSAASGAPIPVQATVSADGATLVWSDVTADGAGVTRVHDKAGTRQVEIPTLPFYYAFSPDGSTLAALGNDPAGRGVALLLIDLAGNRAELVEVGQPYFIDWAPDGERLAVHVDDRDLGLVEGGGERANLDVSPGLFSAPAWTEDGRILAVLALDQITVSLAELQGARFTLALVDPEDASTQRIADLAEAAAFEVSGDRIAYLQADSGLGPLIVVGVDGRNPVEVAPDEVVLFEWSPDGQSLLFYTLGDESLELVPHVWDGDTVKEHPGFVPTEMFITQYLPFWAQYTRNITQWRPDSTAFAYAVDGDGDGGEIRVQPLDGELETVGDGEMVIWAP